MEIVGWPAGSQPTPDSMTCYFVHSALQSQSSISFVTRDIDTQTTTDSASILEGIHDIVIRSALSNFMTIPTDCPSREKRGWTGDGQTAAETLIYNFDMSAAYPKWLGDIAQAQQCNNNRSQCPASEGPFCRQPGDGQNVPDMAPMLFANGQYCTGGGDVAWGSGYVNVLDWVHRYYADHQLASFHYENALAYLEFLNASVHASPTPNNALLDLTHPTIYGDWCAAVEPYGSRHTSNIINGFFWLKGAGIAASLSDYLNKPDAAATWDDVYKRGRAQFNELYLANVETGYSDVVCATPGDRQSKPCYEPSIDGPLSAQTLQSLPITLGLPSNETQWKAVGAALANAVTGNNFTNRTDTGLVGTKYVLPALVATGRPDLAMEIATAMEYPSWGRMLPPTVHPLGTLCMLAVTCKWRPLCCCSLSLSTCFCTNNRARTGVFVGAMESALCLFMVDLFSLPSCFEVHVLSFSIDHSC